MSENDSGWIGLPTVWCFPSGGRLSRHWIEWSGFTTVYLLLWMREWKMSMAGGEWTSRTDWIANDGGRV